MTVHAESQPEPGNESSFLREWPQWTSVVEGVKRSGLTISRWVIRRRTNRPSGQHSWLLWVKPDAVLTKQFDLAPEILLLLAPWREMHAEDIAFVEQQLGEDFRVDRGLVLVIHTQPDAEKHLAFTIPAYRSYLFLDAATLREQHNPREWLRSELQTRLGQMRQFDLRTPAEESQFFGRKVELMNLERKLLSGTCVGIWGLRKIGKTSHMRQLLRKYRIAAEAKNLTPVLVDMMRLNHNSRGFDALLAHLCRGATEAEAERGVNQQVTDFDAWVEAQPGKVVLAIDEYERLLDGKTMLVEDGLRLLDWLRGLVQQSGGKFVLILAGRDPLPIASARIQGVDNPMYRFLADEPLGGLDKDAMTALVRKIGRRMGLEFTHDATALIYQLTGGHPMLTRTLGNLVDVSVATEKRSPFLVDGSYVEQMTSVFLRESSEDFAELFTVAKELAPSADLLLREAAHGDGFRNTTEAQGVVDQLTRWGILQRAGKAGELVEFRIGAFATWICENKHSAAAAE